MCCNRLCVCGCCRVHGDLMCAWIRKREREREREIRFATTRSVLNKTHVASCSNRRCLGFSKRHPKRKGRVVSIPWLSRLHTTGTCCTLDTRLLLQSSRAGCRRRCTSDTRRAWRMQMRWRWRCRCSSCGFTTTNTTTLVCKPATCRGSLRGSLSRVSTQSIDGSLPLDHHRLTSGIWHRHHCALRRDRIL